MNPKIVIRDETHDDVCAISEVNIAAFKSLEISNHTEQFIIEALRTAKASARHAIKSGALSLANGCALR